MTEQPKQPERRDFLKTAAIAAVGFPSIIRAQTVTNAIKVGLVGCGGRGSGAARQALTADDYSELTAVADIAQSQIDRSLNSIKSSGGGRGGRGGGQQPAAPAASKIADRVKVEPSNQFLGLDAFQKVIDSGVDVVLLATPPGFRAQHLEAVISAGKHCFCEKPVSTDAPGVRSVLATSEKAKEKNVSLVAGFCWRYNNMIQDTFQQMENGAIGRIVAYYATYYTNPVKPMPPASARPAGMSDTEWQIRNWYNFVWLGGDGIVEQAVHSADKISWAMHDEPPVSAVGVGGRDIPAEGGDIFDHFEINYVWANGVRGFLACRQIPGCYNENSDYILGTDGICTIGRGPRPHIDGKTNWQFDGQPYDMYQREHDLLFASIRKNQPMNDGKRMATSTMLAMMGRMAAYSGQQVTWDQAWNSQDRWIPEQIDWNGALEVRPRAVPGVTKTV